MDLNEMLHAHQVAVMKASAAGDDRGRDDHFARVAEYAEQIRRLRGVAMTSAPQKGTPATGVHVSSPQVTGIVPSRADGPPDIIYGTYASETSASSSNAQDNAWENEGGAVIPPERDDPPEAGPAEPELPAGVTTRLVRHYTVGPYVYTDLDLALAEHMRRLSDAGEDGEA